MKHLLIAASAVAALCAGAAHAQEASYSGFYVGGFVGGAHPAFNDDETIRVDRDLDGEYNGAADSFPNFSPGFTGNRGTGLTPNDRIIDDESTPIAGLRAGYDMQMGRWVFGGLAEYEVNNVQDNVTAYSTTPDRYVMTRELDNLAAVRGRVGYTFGRFLPYVTGGLARADVEHRFGSTNGTNTFTPTSTGTDSLDGFQLGGGVESRMGNVSLGLEYLFTRLDDDEYSVRASGGPAGGPFTSVNASGTDLSRSEDTFDNHAVRATAMYRF